MFTAILHSFTNIFAGGRSETKTILFFPYVLILFLLYFLYRDKKYKLNKFSLVFPSVTLAIMYLYGLVLHIVYAHKFGFSPWEIAITSRNNELSTSLLGHTHIAKGAVGIILSLFNKAALLDVDAGGAYLGFFPNWVFYLGSIIVITLLFQIVFYFISTFICYLQGKNIRQKLFFILWYGIVSFTLIKTSIDGGILNFSFLVAIVSIVLFFLHQKKLQTYYYISTFITAALIFMSLFIDNISPGDGLTIAALSAFIILLTIIHYSYSPKIRIQFLIPIVILFVCAWWLAASRDRDIYQYEKTTLNQGQLYYHYDNKEDRVITDHAKNNFTLYKNIKGKNITYYPISVPGLTCTSSGKSTSVNGLVITPQPLTVEDNTKNFAKLNIVSSEKKGNFWYSEVVGGLVPCTPEPLSVIDGILKQKNSWYILTKLQFDD